MNATQSQIRDALADFKSDFTSHGDRLCSVTMGHKTYAVIETILQSALDTQKPAGEAAEALAKLGDSSTLDDIERNGLETTIRAALAGKPKDGGDVKYFMEQAVYYIMNGCGNSYSNAWCEHLLTIAKKHGAYNGEVVGKIIDLKEALTDDNAKRGDLSSCWYVKDYADGWIKYHDGQVALREAEKTGAIMMYSHTGSPPDTTAADAKMGDLSAFIKHKQQVIEGQMEKALSHDNAELGKAYKDRMGAKPLSQATGDDHDCQKNSYGDITKCLNCMAESEGQ